MVIHNTASQLYWLQAKLFDLCMYIEFKIPITSSISVQLVILPVHLVLLFIIGLKL